MSYKSEFKKLHDNTNSKNDLSCICAQLIKTGVFMTSNTDSMLEAYNAQSSLENVSKLHAYALGWRKELENSDMELIASQVQLLLACALRDAASLTINRSANKTQIPENQPFNNVYHILPTILKKSYEYTNQLEKLQIHNDCIEKIKEITAKLEKTSTNIKDANSFKTQLIMYKRSTLSVAEQEKITALKPLSLTEDVIILQKHMKGLDIKFQSDSMQIALNNLQTYLDSKSTDDIENIQRLSEALIVFKEEIPAIVYKSLKNDDECLNKLLAKQIKQYEPYIKLNNSSHYILNALENSISKLKLSTDRLAFYKQQLNDIKNLKNACKSDPLCADKQRKLSAACHKTFELLNDQVLATTYNFIEYDLKTVIKKSTCDTDTKTLKDCQSNLRAIRKLQLKRWDAITDLTIERLDDKVKLHKQLKVEMTTKLEVVKDKLSNEIAKRECIDQAYKFKMKLLVFIPIVGVIVVAALYAKGFFSKKPESIEGLDLDLESSNSASKNIVSRQPA